MSVSGSPTLVLLLGVFLSAWLRFDAGFPVIAWAILLLVIVGVMAMWVRQARRAPPIRLPPAVAELSGRDDLTEDEEEQFAADLQRWHRDHQVAEWRNIERQGLRALIVPRAILYFMWLSVLALALLPPSLVPPTFLRPLPRFLVVLLTMAVVGLLAAAPLALRDYTRIRRELSRQEAV